MRWRLQLSDAVYNLAVLVLVALPVVFLANWIISVIAGHYTNINILMALSSGFYYAAIFAGPVLLGGLIHQVILAFVPPKLSRWQRRGLAFLAAWVVPGCVVLLGEPPEVMAWMAIPIALALVLYVSMLRLPQAST